MIAALLPNTLVRRPTITPRTPQLRAKLADFDPPPPADDDYVDKFCRATNAAMEATVFPTFIRDAVAIRPSRPQSGFLETIKSPPELQGLAQPVGSRSPRRCRQRSAEQLHEFSVEQGSSTTSCGATAA